MDNNEDKIEISASLVIKEDLKKEIRQKLDSEFKKALDLIIMNSIENVLKDTKVFENIVVEELNSYFKEKVAESLKNNAKLDRLVEECKRKVLSDIEKELKGK